MSLSSGILELSCSATLCKFKVKGFQSAFVEEEKRRIYYLEKI